MGVVVGRAVAHLAVRLLGWLPKLLSRESPRWRHRLRRFARDGRVIVLPTGVRTTVGGWARASAAPRRALVSVWRVGSCLARISLVSRSYLARITGEERPPLILKADGSCHGGPLHPPLGTRRAVVDSDGGGGGGAAAAVAAASDAATSAVERRLPLGTLLPRSASPPSAAAASPSAPSSPCSADGPAASRFDSSINRHDRSKYEAACSAAGCLLLGPCGGGAPCERSFTLATCRLPRCRS